MYLGNLLNSTALPYCQASFFYLYRKNSKHYSRDIACAISNSNDTVTFELAWNVKAICKLPVAYLGPSFFRANFSIRDTPHTFRYQITLGRLTLAQHAILVQPKEPRPPDAGVVSQMFFELSSFINPSAATW